MDPITWTVLANLLVKYGPSAISLGANIDSNIAAGKGQTEVTAADWAELDALSKQSAEDIYAKEGITPPPAPTPP
jgi:hypothetical protein